MAINLVRAYCSIVKKFRSSGKNKITYLELEEAIMEVLNTIRRETIRRNIEAMERLGFIRKDRIADVWEICTERHKFDETETEREINEFTEKFSRSISD